MLSGCSIGQQSGKPLAQQDASTKTQQKKQSKPKTKEYTQADLSGTQEYCEEYNRPGYDIFIPESTDQTLGLTTLVGEGTSSELYQCVFRYLDIPQDTINRISTVSEDEQTDKVDNLNVLWHHPSDGAMEVYFSLKDFE